jgi:quercetin dioxygenase-like cupin family protein
VATCRPTDDEEEPVEIRSDQAPIKGPAEWFTGDVSIARIVQGEAPSTLSIGSVHFEPGARTAWHSHANGQTLFVIDGEGRVQARGEPIFTIRPGDVVSCPADEWHWHGASPDHAMTHLSVTDGGASWGEHVSDAEYGGQPS